MPVKRVPGAAGGTQGRPRPPGRTRALCPGLNVPLFAGAAPRGSKRPDPDPNFWGHTHRSSPHPPRAASGHPAGSPLWGVLCAPPHFGVLPPRTPVLWVLGGGRQGPPPSLGTPGGGQEGARGAPRAPWDGGPLGGAQRGGVPLGGSQCLVVVVVGGPTGGDSRCLGTTGVTASPRCWGGVPISCAGA